MEELLGQGHRWVVDMLCARIEALSSGHTTVPCVVILEGASGVGKTRVVRELYSRVRRVWDPEGYWPKISEASGANGGDPLLRRKSIGPEVDGFTWPAGALPGFGWWQLHCERMQTGQVIDVVAQARPEIQTHLLPVALAWRRAASVKEKLEAKKADLALSARTALQEGGLEAATQVLAAVGIAIPGLGTAASWAFAGARAAVRQRELQKEKFEDVELGQRFAEHRRSASEELAELILGVAHSEVPGVVVIEDIHLMDSALADFLDHVSKQRPQHPVLVVAMAWPENRDVGSYGSWSRVALMNGLAERISMPSLMIDDLRRIVWNYAPNTPVEIASEVARLCPTPLALEATLASRKVLRAIEMGDGSLPLSALGAHPAGLTEIYRDRFRQLPDEMQEALAVAAGSLPNASSAQVAPFVREIIASAVRRCGDLPTPTEDVVRGIKNAADQQIWLVPGEDADWFREALQAQVAYDHLERQLFLPQDCAELRESVFNVLADWVDDARGDGYILDLTDKTAIISRWLLELADKSS
jgi:hypothetical protein